MGKYIFDAYLYIFDVLTVLPNIIFSFLSDLGLSDKKDRWIGKYCWWNLEVAKLNISCNNCLGRLDNKNFSPNSGRVPFTGILIFEKWNPLQMIFKKIWLCFLKISSTALWTANTCSNERDMQKNPCHDVLALFMTCNAHLLNRLIKLHV